MLRPVEALGHVVADVVHDGVSSGMAQHIVRHIVHLTTYSKVCRGRRIRPGESADSRHKCLCPEPRVRTLPSMMSHASSSVVWVATSAAVYLWSRTVDAPCISTPQRHSLACTGRQCEATAATHSGKSFSLTGVASFGASGLRSLRKACTVNRTPCWYDHSGL